MPPACPLIKQVAAREYKVWYSMIDRCHNPKSRSYRRYGARGIQVCAAWRESFEQFLSDMGPRPSSTRSLDRYPDRNGNYEPKNVRWATRTEQARNTNRNVRVKWNEKQLTLAALCEQLGKKYSRVQARLKRGWPLKRALTVGRRVRGYKRYRSGLTPPAS